MMVRIILCILTMVLLAGCASSQKQVKEKQRIINYEKSPKTYYEDDSLSEYESPKDKYSIPSDISFEEKSVESTQLSARQIQKALKNAGYYQSTIDGIIGPKTKSAILKFQKAHNLKADGVVGKKTSAKLKEYLYK